MMAGSTVMFFTLSLTKIILIVLHFDIVFVSATSASTGSPNVLFFVIDDLKPTLGCYNNPIMKTLNIDNLASKSILFERAYVQQAICGPSRVSFLTSRRPDTTLLYDFYSYWRVHAGNYTTLPQHFKENGYITQSVGKVFHPGIASNHSDDSPYSWTNTPYHPPTQQYKMAKVCPNPDGSLAMNVVCPVDVDKMPEKSLPDLQSADFAVDFLQNMSTNGSAPFFLAVGFHKPHIPLKYPKEYLDLYPLSEITLAKHRTYPLRLPLVAWNPWTDIRLRDDVKKLNVSFPFGPVPDSFELLMRQSYYAATSYMDAQVGRVLAALDKYNFSDNTIVSFVGDHGWSMGEHQEWSKYSLYNEAVLVPLLMYIPGLTHVRQQKQEKIFPFLDPFKDPRQNDRNFIIEKNLKSDKDRNNNIQRMNIPVNNFYSKATGYNADIIKQMPLSAYGSSNTMSLKFEKASASDLHQLSSQNTQGYRTSAQVELVDIFPTLAEAAGLPLLAKCPSHSFHTMLCTEGASFMPLIRNVVKNNVKDIDKNEHLNEEENNIYNLAKECSSGFQPPKNGSVTWKKAVFSQYPRPSVEPQENSDKPNLKDIRIMGYSLWTASFHYTEWVGFDPSNYTIHWMEVYGKELYINSTDVYEENNMAEFENCAPLMTVLSTWLHEGWSKAQPTSGDI